MADRLQTRLEQGNLHRLGYVAKRLHDIAVDYSIYLGGKSPELWLRELAIELVRQADRIAGQPTLDAPDAAPHDVVFDLIAGARNYITLDRIRDAYGQRWSPGHEQAARQRRTELERARGG